MQSKEGNGPAPGRPGWYLMEGQAVLVLGLVPAPQVKAVECSAQGRGQGKVLDDLHGAGWEDAADPVDLPQIPVLIQLSEQHDDVPLVEPQLPGVVPSVGVQGLGSRDLWDEKQPLQFVRDSDAQHRQNSPKAFVITGKNLEVYGLSRHLLGLTTHILS